VACLTRAARLQTRSLKSYGEFGIEGEPNHHSVSVSDILGYQTTGALSKDVGPPARSYTRCLQPGSVFSISHLARLHVQLVSGASEDVACAVLATLLVTSSRVSSFRVGP
jgi:hypothetical protein